MVCYGLWFAKLFKEYDSFNTQAVFSTLGLI